MALHVEASVALVMRLCRGVRPGRRADAGEVAYMRLLTPGDQILGLQECTGLFI